MSKRLVYLQRFLVLCLGLFCAVLGLEVALRALGLAQRLAQGWLRPSADARVVLCLGDSYTACPGVARNETYPAQLEQQLNAGSPTGRFQVLNLGLNGQNTTILKNELPANLQKYRPDVVVLLTGGANVWDLTGYQAFVRGDSVSARALDLLGRIRVYKLARLVVFGFQGRHLGEEPKPVATPLPPRPKRTAAGLEEGFRALQRVDYATAERCFRQALAVDPKDAAAWDGLAMVCTETSRIEEGIRAGEEAIRLDPTCAVYYDHLSRLYDLNRQGDKAIECLLTGLERGDDRYDRDEKVRLLQHLLSMASREDLARMAGRLQEIAATRPQLQPFLTYSRPASAGLPRAVEWVARDLEQIIGTCRSQGIPVVLMNYPHQANGGLSPVFATVARRLSLHFVDNRQSFQGLPADQYFLPDGHCSRIGNARVASNARRAVLEVLGLVPGSSPAGPTGPAPAPAASP